MSVDLIREEAVQIVAVWGLSRCLSGIAVVMRGCVKIEISAASERWRLVLGR